MSLISAFDGGLGQPTDRIDIGVPRHLMGTTTTAAFTANTVYLFRFQLDRPARITKIGTRTGATIVASSVDLGIYSGDATASLAAATFTRMGSTGIITPATSSNVETALTAAVSLEAGIPYWAAFAVNNATDTILRISIDSVIMDPGLWAVGKNAAWSSGLPSSLTGVAAVGLLPALSLVTT